jgi:glucose/arabinose dehydrogenase
MLHREHSDFQWFKERTQSLNSEPISRYSGMATVGAPLNSEPALPRDRAEHDLPSKSYADAVISGNRQADGHPPERRPSMSAASSATAVDDAASRAQLDEDKLTYEKHAGSSGGGMLTSMRPGDSWEEALRHNRTTAPRDQKRQAENRPRSRLASGRKAGAGWQRSA